MLGRLLLEGESEPLCWPTSPSWQELEKPAAGEGRQVLRLLSLCCGDTRGVSWNPQCQDLGVSSSRLMFPSGHLSGGFHESYFSCQRCTYTGDL